MKRVQVYYNLHKHKLSVRYKGKVIDHVDEIILTDVKFVVQPAGRDRVRRTGRKNVHAYIHGLWITKARRSSRIHQPRDLRLSHSRRVTYNPYDHQSFIIKSTGTPIYISSKVHIKGKEIRAAT